MSQHIIYDSPIHKVTDDAESNVYQVTLEDDRIIAVPKSDGNVQYREVLVWIADGGEVTTP